MGRKLVFAEIVATIGGFAFGQAGRRSAQLIKYFLGRQPVIRFVPIRRAHWFHYIVNYSILLMLAIMRLCGEDGRMTPRGAEFPADDYALAEAPNPLATVEGTYPDLVRIYLNQIGKVALLSAEQEVDLAKRIEAGLYAEHKLARATEEGRRLDPQLREDLMEVKRDGEGAKAHLLAANVRLVVNIAKRTRNKGLDLLDRIQEGNLGLIRAVEKFDYTQGFKFSTYATWWIRQAISRGQTDKGRTVRIPVHITEQLTAISKVQEGLHRKLNRDATDEELAAETGLEVGKLRQLLNHSRDSATVSLDALIGNEEAGTLGDIIADSEGIDPVLTAVEDADQHEQIKAALASLSERDRGIVCRRYGLYDGRPQTLAEVSKAYGLSRERVRQIEIDALDKLRKGHFKATLKDLL